MSKRMSYTVIWLDADGYASEMYYFEAENFLKAFNRVRAKFTHHLIEAYACGFLLQKASLEVHRRYFDMASNAKMIKFARIEITYAPEHLIRKHFERQGNIRNHSQISP
jgi:hypothetical protein